VSIAAFFKVVLVAVSLGLDVFAVSVGVGLRGMSRAARIRIGLAFTTAEVSMTLIGVGIGTLAGRLLGNVAGYLGFAALIGVGIYMVYEALRQSEAGGFDLSRGWGLFLGALSISLDSLGIGFSIVYIGVPLAVTLGAIAFASVASTALGLAFGQQFGARVGERAGLFAGVVLILTGGLFAILKYFHLG
jgi:putative Mn2+ efflux pump MntP